MSEKIRIETIKTNGFTMNFFRFGHGDKTLVILPGLSIESVMNYADAVAAAYRLLADRFTVYVFDRTEEPPAGYTVCGMARDTAAAIRALGLDEIYLFGASQGGMIAMRIAITEPSLVKKLVLGSTAARMTKARYLPVKKWIGMAKAGKAEELYLAFAEAIYPRDIFAQAKDSLCESAKAVTQKELDRFVILAESMKDFDAAGELKNITCPVLAVGSDDDRVLGTDAAAEIAEQFDGRQDFELYTYSGCGHAAYDTAPDYKERLLRFLAPDSPR